MLTLDNFSGHGSLEQLARVVPSWLIIDFLPENTTSILQPMDGGIIARFKRNYRKLLLQRLVTEAEDPAVTVDSFKKNTNVLHAVQMADEAWSGIDADEIKRVWDRTLFTGSPFALSAEGMTKEKRQELLELDQQAREALVELAQKMGGRGGDDIQQLMDEMGEDMVDEFMSLWLDCDEGADKERPTIEEVVAELGLGEQQEGEEDGEEEVDSEQVIADTVARNYLRQLARYFEARSDDFNDAAFLRRMVNRVDELAHLSMKQTRVTDFFLQTEA